MSRLCIEIEILSRVLNPIVGFIVKNDKGLELIGDNTGNLETNKRLKELREGDHISTEFIFTMPLLQQGEYSITASIAAGSRINIQYCIGLMMH